MKYQLFDDNPRVNKAATMRREYATFDEAYEIVTILKQMGIQVYLQENIDIAN